jgi:hypothetical protein
MKSSRPWIRRTNPTRAAHSAAYLQAIANNQAATVAATNVMLGNRTFPKRDPYTRAMSGRYGTTLASLDDDFFSVKPIIPGVVTKAPEPKAAEGSVWGDVLKIFAGGLSMGLANKIGGRAPAPTTIVNPQPAGMPTWAKVALVGTAGVGVYLLARR